MADITKVMVVEIGNIAKLGPKEKSAVEKLGPKDRPDPAPTCTTYTWGFGDTGRSACQNTNRTTHYHDESIDKLYTDSCGGTEAADGYYSDGSGYYSYSAAGGLDTQGRSCGR